VSTLAGRADVAREAAPPGGTGPGGRAAPEGLAAVESLPIVAVVGRPNVGKSTLVNRILGRRAAIVEERPGVTRDRTAFEARWAGRRFALVDTGGFVPGGGALERAVSRQAWRAVEEADLVVLVVDVRVGIAEEDLVLAEALRKSGRSEGSVLVAANKVDAAAFEPDAYGFARLGLGDPWPVSALHGRGSGELLDEIVARLPQRQGAEGAVAPRAEASAPTGPELAAVAIVGRPNVGKSTLFNRLVGDERSVTHDRPGTTRDAVDTVVRTEAGTLRFVDTAGLRRKARIDEPTEYYALVRALQAIDRADVALFVLDAAEGVTHQDQRLAERVDAAGHPMVVVLNKWDLVPAGERAAVRGQVEDRLGFLAYAPVHAVSARTGLGVGRLLPSVEQAIAAYRRRIPTRALNRLVQQAQAAHPAPGGRVLYAVQGATDPPTVTLFATRRLSPPWLRYLERRIREEFALGPTPVKLRVRRRGA
jgi:GTP-binding protein